MLKTTSQQPIHWKFPHQDLIVLVLKNETYIRFTGSPANKTKLPVEGSAGIFIPECLQGFDNGEVLIDVRWRKVLRLTVGQVG